MASLRVDPFTYVFSESQTEDEVHSQTLTLDTEDMERSPKLFFTLDFPQLMTHEAVPCTQVQLLQRRKAALESRFEQLSSDMGRIQQVLMQQKAAFDSVQFTEEELVVVDEDDKRASGLRVCISSADGRKHCLIM